MKIWTDLSCVLSQSTRLTDRQTDRRTDRQTDSFLITSSRWHSMQCENNANNGRINEQIKGYKLLMQVFNTKKHKFLLPSAYQFQQHPTTKQQQNLV